nr:hypothetical chloroplast RF1 [Chlorokybus atmophyticus]
MNQIIGSWQQNMILSYSHSPFILGVFCGGLLATSMTVASFISLRRLIIQGIPAGIVSYLGSAFSETLFIYFILFGSIDILHSWVVLEPSIKLVVAIFCYDTILGFFVDNRLKVVSFAQKTDLLKIFLCNAVIIFANPGSTWASSTLITSIEGFEFRENWFFLLGLFLGLFLVGCGIGFLILGLTHLWMLRSNKTFRSLVYRFNKIVSSLTLTLLLISTIYYHIDFYQGLSFTTLSAPLKASPELEFLDDIEIIRAFSNYKHKMLVKTRSEPMKTLGGLPVKEFGKWFRKNVTGLQDLDARGLPRKKTSSGKYARDYKAMELVRDKKWFSRSQNYRFIRDKILSLLSIQQEKVKFYQHPSFIDPQLATKEDLSPYLSDNQSKRIIVREIKESDYNRMLQDRKQRISDLTQRMKAGVANP